jgi:4-hydroxybenzoate polyprenyltransferase
MTSTTPRNWFVSTATHATDLLFLTRPVLLGPVWVIYGAGAVLAGGTPGIDLLFVSLLVAGVYVHNQITDRDTDRANNKLPLLSGEYVQTREAWILTVALWVIAGVWAITEGERGLLYLLAFLCGILYDAPQHPLKGRPWGGIVVNAAAHGTITFLAGWTSAGGFWIDGLLASIPYTAAVAGVYLATTIADTPGDEQAGKITLSVKHGVGSSAWCTMILTAVSTVAAIILTDWWMATAGLVATGWAASLAIRPKVPNAQRYVKAAVGGLAILVAARWYLLIPIAIATFIASRTYYHVRFGMQYPSIGAEPNA